MTDDELANVRTGYQVAVSLSAEASGTYWSRVAAMVYSNTILIAAICVVLTSTRSKQLWLVVIVLAVLGLVLCKIWKLLMERGYDHYRYWIYSARELEISIGPVQTLQRGEKFSKGDPVDFHWSEAKVERLQTSTKQIHMLTCWVIHVFAIMYALFAVVATAT